MHFPKTLIGILFVSTGLSINAVKDGMAKLLGDYYPPLMLVWVHLAFTSLLLIPIVWKKYGPTVFVPTYFGMQILRSGFGFKRLTKILITHGHLDHILGLAGLLSTLTRWEAIEHVEIWAGRSALDRIRNLIFGVVFRGETAQFKIEFIEL